MKLIIKSILTLSLASATVTNAQVLKNNKVDKEEPTPQKVEEAPKKEAEKPVVEANKETPKVVTLKEAKPNTDSTKATLNRPAKAKLAALDNDKTTTVSSEITRRYEYKGTRFKKVPLIDETKYYGRNHGKMVDYTKKYLANRTRTFNAVNQRNRAGKIFPMMNKIFDKYQIPHEMKYLSVIESALNNKALSPVGAYGPWQFMPSTGQMMGLTVTASRDDRSNWVKSTHAACKYMTYLYDQLGDWLLVVAAYNSGPRPVIRAIKKTGKRDYWAIKQYLPRETQNHVLAFVATASVFELIPQYATTNVPSNFDWSVLNKKIPTIGGIDEEREETNPLKMKFGKTELAKMAIVRINTPIDLDYLSNYLEADRSQLGRWNADYFDFLEEFKNDGRTYNLKLPKDKLDKFLQNRAYIERQSAKLGR